MKEQQQAPRRKLQPKKSIKGISKKRRTAPPNYSKEEVLTANQQAWVHSLTVSLSGWRSRQQFYKDHLEPKIQAEAEATATEAAYNAECLTQRGTEEKEEAEKIAIEKSEAEKEKAEAWVHKAWEMHMAGRGARELQHEYYGWDHEEEGYLRDLETKKLIAVLKARSKAERRAELRSKGLSENDVCDSDKDDCDDSDLDGCGSLDITNPDSASRSTSGPPSRFQSQPSPAIERAPEVDWRGKARAGVIKKKLFATKGWGAITWNQKSNIQERLLVLEDDGYDIQRLLDGKATSEQVTSIILERASAEQEAGCRASRPAIRPGQSVSPQDTKSSTSAWLDPALMEHFLGPVKETLPLGSASKSLSPVTSSPRSAGSSHQRSDDNEMEDNTQPFSFDEPYYPRPSRRLKRKRDDDAESDIEDNVKLSFPAYKKRRVEFAAEDELAAQALQGIKRADLRKVFRSARLVNRKSLPPSRIVFSAQAPSVSEIRSQASSLNYLYSDSPTRGLTKSSFSISKCAFDNIMAELRFLTGTTEEYNTIQIFDPDYDEDLEYTPTKPEERIKRDKWEMQRQALHIAITRDAEGQVAFQSDAIILAELLKALRERTLLHRADWEWDGLRLRRSNDLQWSLSPRTHDTFVEIESRLERRSRTGSVEVLAGVVDDPRTDNA